MSDIGLSYVSAKKYLGLLLDFGLVEKNSRKYVTSLKGERFLEVYVELNNLLADQKSVTLKNTSLIKKMENKQIWVKARTV